MSANLDEKSPETHGKRKRTVRKPGQISQPGQPALAKRRRRDDEDPLLLREREMDDPDELEDQLEIIFGRGTEAEAGEEGEEEATEVCGVCSRILRNDGQDVEEMELEGEPYRKIIGSVIGQEFSYYVCCSLRKVQFYFLHKYNTSRLLVG